MYNEHAIWYLNNTQIGEANSTSFVKSSGTYIRETGGKVTVKYSFMAALPNNDQYPMISFKPVNLSAFLFSLVNVNNQNLKKGENQVINNANGYCIKNIYSNLTVVRYGFFSGMSVRNNGFRVFPIMNGLNFIIISNGENHNATFVSKDYKLLIYGLVIYGVTISSLIAYSIITHKTKKTLGKKLEKIN